MGTHRLIGCCCTVSLLALAPAALAGVAYTDPSAWRLATTERGVVRSLDLATIGKVPDTGATFIDDEGTLVFPDNHTGIEVYADGWMGDVHTGPAHPADHVPHENRFTFASPVTAFAATVSVGADLDPDLDSVLLTLGDDNHRLFSAQHPFSQPAFFGWTGDTPVTEIVVRSGLGSHFYAFRDVQYVTAVTAVPEPAGPLTLLAFLILVARRHRREGIHAELGGH